MRYLQLIFVFVFIFIGLVNVIYRVAASNKAKRATADNSGKLSLKMKKVETLLPGEAREYKDQKINVEPEAGFTEEDVPEPDTSGLTAEAYMENPVLSDDAVAGISRISGVGRTPEHVMLKTDTSPVFERSIQPGEITEGPGALKAALTSGSNNSGMDIKRDQISAWEKIDNLSILKKAIVLSEILGPPKGDV